MEKGAADAGRATGDKVVWTQGTQFSVPDTVKRMQVAIATHPDVMVVTNIDPAAFEPLMKQAEQQGIAVIDANAASPSSSPPYLTYVGANEYMAGQEAAKQTLAAGKPTRAACEIQVLASTALEDRCRGYRDVLSAAGVKVDTVDVSGTPSQAQAKMDGYFTSHSDANAAYLLTADPAFLTPMMTVKNKFATRKITLVTNDTSSDVFNDIKTGTVLGTIGQQQYLQGYLPVIYADLYKRYGFLPATNTYTGPSFIDKSNVEQVINQGKEGVG